MARFTERTEIDADGQCNARHSGARVKRANPESRDSGLDAYASPRNDGALFTLPRAAQQKYTLLAEHVPEPPGQIHAQRPAVRIQRDCALHLDVDLVAELHEILDG